MGDLSKNFDRSEFACQGKDCCCHSAPIHPDLVAGLQLMRIMSGVPLSVTSGFRCVKHNSSIGGTENSLHTFGMAADVKCDVLTIEQLAEYAKNIGVFRYGGIGLYCSWIHIDVRQTGKARWDKR